MQREAEGSVLLQQNGQRLPLRHSLGIVRLGQINMSLQVSAKLA
jgi:hypothetical protein